MIDFRYHLISIVAVMLSLALGILVGSGFLGDLILEDVERRVERVTQANQRLRVLGEDLQRRVNEANEFARAAAPLLTNGQLQGESVIMLVVDGSDEATLAGIEEQLLESGARVDGTMRFSDRFRLETVADREQLAVILRSVLTDPEELLAHAGTMLGSRLAGAAEAGSRGEPNEIGRLHALVDELQEADFLTASFQSEERFVPQGALFVLVAGDDAPPPFPVEDLVVPLGGALAERQATFLAAEPSNSVWNIVGALREHAETADGVATVDQAEDVPGQIAVVLGLAGAERGEAGHYGVGDGAAAVIPPAPGS